MNKAYRVKWNEATNSYVAVPETAKGNGKGSRRTRRLLALIASGLTLSGTAMATDVTIPVRVVNGSNYSDPAMTTVVDNGDTVNLTGVLEYAKQSVGTRMTLQEALATGGGYISGPDLSAYQELLIEDKSQTISVPDPVMPGNKITVSVYAPTSFRNDGVLGTLGGANAVTIYDPNSSPYVNARLATVSNGTLNIDLGVGSNFDLGAAKQTSLVLVDGTRGTRAEAVWSSGGVVNFGGSSTLSATPAQTAGYTKDVEAISYKGDFSVTDKNGSTTDWNVTDVESLRLYNTWLVQKLEDGSISVSSYDNLLKEAYTMETVTVTVNPVGANTLAPDHPLYLATGDRALLQADGVNATARVTSSADNPIAQGYGTTLLATNGGTVINDGRIGARADAGNAITVYNGNGSTTDATTTRSPDGVASRGINNGVITIGYSSTAADASAPDGVYTGQRNIVNGANSELINNGIINTSVATAIGSSVYYGINTVAVGASDKGTFINRGAMNLGVNGTSTSTTNLPVGVNVSDGGIAINDTTGVIYVGRGASGDIQRDADGNVSIDSMAAGGADTIINGSKDVNKKAANAIQVASSRSQVDNRGTIVLGTGVQGGAGIYVHARGANNMSVVNQGTIDILGQREGSPLANQGIYVYGPTAATNTIENAASGIINLKGVNGIGIQTVEGGKATNAGTINVFAVGDLNAALPNYGMWAEGAGSTVTLSGSGKVNLKGDNAIGVHARDGGEIQIAGDGKVNFDAGRNQIGYYVHGATSSISNTATGAQDVSTEGSTLFRMASGAGFVGGAGATSTLTASGKDSVAVLVTGRDAGSGQASQFSSGGMTIDVIGDGATGVVVEGGAQGTIASNAVINLDKTNATAAIVDGQAHDTSGAAQGAIDGTTSLQAAATLNSSLDGVTGYIARNGATLTNSGAIDFSGADTTGISVEEGSIGTNTGDIKVANGGTGLTASSSGAATTLNNSGTLTLSGGSDSQRTVGVSADGSAVTVNFTDGSIEMQGQGAIGVQALNGATVNLSGSAMPVFATSGATNQIAFRLAGTDSKINVAGGTVFDARGTDSTLFRIEDGASLDGVLNMRVSGTGAQGIVLSGATTVMEVTSGSAFDVAGDGASALNVSGGAETTIQAGVTMNLSGNGAVAGVVDGNTYDLAGKVLAPNSGAKLTNDTNLTSGLSGATAFVTQNRGILLNNGNIDMSAGTGNTGVRVLGGEFENHGDITVDGTALYVEGAGSVIDNRGGNIVATGGEAAVKLGQNASLSLLGSGLSDIKANGGAHGVLVGTGAASLVADGSVIHVMDSGNGIENQADIADIQLKGIKLTVANGAGVRTGNTLAKTNSGSITVNGAGAGIAFTKADGSMTSHGLDMSDSAGLVITANAAGGHGIVTNTSGEVLSGASVNITNAAGGEALVIQGTTNKVVQSGILRSSSTTAAVVDAGSATDITNTGQIIAANTSRDAFKLGDGVSLKNEAGALISGVVAFKEGDNALVNSGAIDGKVSAGDGDNAVTVTDTGSISDVVTLGDGDNRVVLSGHASVTTVQAGSGSNNFTLEGNGQSFTMLDGGVGGHSELTLNNHQRELTDASVFRHFEQVNLTNGSSLTLKTALEVDDAGSDTSTVAIDDGSTLAIDTTGAFTLNNELIGNGTVSVNTTGGAFDFTNNVGNGFAGAVELGNTTFNLAADNTAALTQAKLMLGAGSTTTVGTGEQLVGSLAFNGGTAVFDVTVPADREAAGTITTADQLDLNGTGTVQIKLPHGVGLSNDTPAANTSANLLEQDDQTTLVQLAKSRGSVSGTAGSIALVDQNGDAVTAAQTFDITQGGNVAAQGTYDYRLMSGAASDGLYVGYGLKEVELLGTGADALVLTPGAGATGAATDLSAKVTGAGDIAIDAGAGSTLSLSHGGNDYTGVTTVRSGTLKVANNNALGQTSQLVIQSNAATDLGGHTQTIGTLDGQAGSTLDLKGGALTIANGGVSDGTLQGAGTLRLDAGTLTVRGANTALSASTTIAGGAEAALDNVQGLGTGAIAIADDGKLALSGASGIFANAVSGEGTIQLNAADVIASGDNSGFKGQFDIGAGDRLEVAMAQNLGTASIANAGDLVVNTATDWTLDRAVTGAGNLTKAGEGTLNIGDGLAYTGETRVAAGTLIVGDALNPNRALGAAGAGEVTVDAGAKLAGLGTVNGHVTNAGTISALNALSGQASAPAGDFTLAGGLTNAGMVNLAGTSVGNRLVVKGDYVGQNGTVVINTELGGDNSATDKLVIDGGHASGSTGIRVQKAGGNGAQTNVGIRVVETANGGTTEAQAFKLDPGSTGYRSGVGTLSAGGYDYGLKRGGDGGTADDWYLVSAGDDLPSIHPEPVGGEGEPDTDKPGSNPGAAAPATSPEVGAYLANRSAATNAFAHTLHDRKGQASAEGQGNANGLGWGRIEGRQGSRTGVGGLDIENTDRLLHGGIDLLQSNAGEGSVTAGAMAAYFSGSTSSTSRLLGTATGTVEGYGLGGYATWYGNRDRDIGPYADAYVMFGGFDNKVGGAGLEEDGYRSRVVTGSLEGGYSFKVYEDGKTKAYVVPQAQVIASNYRADAHFASGTYVSGMNGTDVTARLGVRVHTKTDTGEGTNLRPFVDLNWVHGPASQNLAMDANQFRDEMPANRIEAKLGVESQVTKQLSAWGSAGVAVGSKNYTSVSGQIGIKYTW